MLEKGKARNKLMPLAFGLCAMVVSACSGSGGSSSGGSTTSVTAADVVSNYTTIVRATYADSVLTAQALELAINNFVADPTEENFAAARTAWLEAREPYGQTEVYRFYNGPIDGASGPEALMNAWPLDEAYIDYVDGNATAGIINDTTVTITEENLINLNEADAENTISTGYHAIEFLLWGQDLNELPGTAGQRPFTDFVTDGSGTNSNQDRRGQYLEAVASLLITHLQQVQAEWLASGDYFAEFSTVDTTESLGRIMLGLGSMAGGELAGERMSVALVAQDQEDEHSCFSDNTHRDIVGNFQGILNIYTGTYTRVDNSIAGNGNGLSDLIEAVNPTLNAQIQANLLVAAAAVEEISDLAVAGTPFDEQIIGGETENRARIQTVIDSLELFADQLSEAAADLGVDLNALDLDGE